MLLFDVIKNNVTTPCSLVTYETKKCSPSVLLRSVSSLFFESLLYFLRARICSSVGKSLSKPYENRSSYGAAEFSHRDHNFSFSLIYLCLLLFTLLLPIQHAHTAPQISIVWGTTTNASSSDVLKGFDGVPLSAGVQGNGDGDLVELGYFSEATVGSPFSGTWIPLTKQTKVGDSSSGYGFGNGMFIFTSNFFQNSDQVVVFPTEPKEYSEDLGFTITSSTPPTGTPFCIRFYDGSQKGEARYNTVTGDNWLWPAFPNGSSIPSNFYIKIASGFAPAGSSWKYGSTFEDNDPADRFKTTISPQYTIGVAISDYSNGQGSVTDINGSYGWGETVNLAATPAPHSDFMGWIGEGIAETWNQNTTLTVNGDQTVYAEFFAIPYLLNLEAQGDGSVIGSGTFVFGDVVSINAYPSYGHSFVRWEKDGAPYSTSAEETITMDGDTDLVAIFARNQYQINVGSTEGGSYEILDEAGLIPSNYSHGFDYILRALPDPHYAFSNWASSASGLSMIGNAYFAHTSFIPTDDANFTAYFHELSYQLNIESSQGFTSLTNSGSFPALSMVPVEVETAEGFVFDYWLDPLGILTDPNSRQTEANMSLIYPYNEASISAILRLDDYDENDINITSDFGGNLFLETDEAGGFTHFKSYELNATALLGYQFDRWIGDTEQLLHNAFEPNNEVLIEGPLSLRATYIYTEYQIDLSNEGLGNVFGPESFTISETPQIKAFPFPGWQFTHWTGDADYLLDFLSAETAIQVANNSAPKDLSFVANFIPKNYEITLNTSGSGEVDVFLTYGDNSENISSEEFTVNSETQITLEANPSTGWSFSIWSGLPELSELLDPIAYIDPYSSLSYFYPPKDLNITANFQVSEYGDDQININIGTGGDVTFESEENGNFLHFASYDLNASPQKGYTFTRWEIEPARASILSYGLENAINEITIDGAVDINATFSPVLFNLSLNSHEGGEVTGPSTYTVLDSPVIQAIPSPGWEFSHWSGDTEYLSNSNSEETIVRHDSLELKDLSLTANFTREIYQVGLNSVGTGTFTVYVNDILDTTGSAELSRNIDSNTVIGIHAIPSSGWKFSNWFNLPDPDDLIDPNPSLNIGSSEIRFIPAADTNMTAQFQRAQFALDILDPNFGGSSTAGGVYPFETLVDINAFPDEHYSFKEWIGDTDALVYTTTLPNNQIRIPDFNVSIRPTFEPKIYSLNLIPNEDGYFEITGTYNGTSHSNQNEYNATASITISALPNDSANYMLSNIYWQNNSSGESGFQYHSTFTIPFLDGNYSIWASFAERNEIGYNLLSFPANGGTAGTDNEFSNDQTQRIIATTNPGFSFIGWSSSSVDTYSPNWSLHSVDTSLQANDEVRANFSPVTQFMSLQYDDSMGTITGFSNEIGYGNYLNLVAIPNENYAFAGWELNKAVTFEVSKKQSSIKSSFSRISINELESPELRLIRGFTYHFECNLGEGEHFFISESPDGDNTDQYYTSGITGHLTSNGTLSFTIPFNAPSTLYYHSSADRYAGNVIHISNIEETSLLPNKQNPLLNQRITHHFGLRGKFERTRHSLDLSSIGNGEISHTAQDVYFFGDTVSLSAIPDSHWEFSHWEGNLVFEENDSPNIEFSITNDTSVQAVFQKVEYQFDVNSSPLGYGTVIKPSGTFTYGENVTVTANPSSGKLFDEWIETENISLISEEDRYQETATFRVLGNAKVQANFSKIPIEIAVELVSLDQDGGTIEGDIGGTVHMPSSSYYGDTVTLDLNLSSGYTLLRWIDLDTAQSFSSENNVTFTANIDRNLRVELRKLHYQLEITSSNGGATSIDTNEPFYWKDPVEISAIPNEHWEFYRWSGIGYENLNSSTSSQAILFIEKDSNLIAEFRKKEYTLSLNPSPSSFGSFRTGDNTSFDFSATYNFEDNVNILANPNQGKKFQRWEIDSNVEFAEGNATDINATFQIRGNAQITAVFDSIEFPVSYQVLVVDENNSTMENVFGGMIIGPESAKHDENATFELALSNGFKLKHWKIEGDTPQIVSTSNIYHHKIDGDLNITAVLTPKKYEIVAELTPLSAGSIELNGSDDNLTQNNFSYGAEISLTASPSSGYVFVKWTATGTILSQPNETNQSFSIVNDVKLTAIFAPEDEVTLTLHAYPIGSASFRGDGTHAYDPNHTISAFPRTGYIFKEWQYNGLTADGVVRNANSATTSLSLDGNKTLTAIFEEDPNPPVSEEKFLLNVYSSNTSHGTTSGSGFFHGIAEIKAFPKDGYRFSHWVGGFPTDVNSPITTISVISKTNIVAYFESTVVVDEPEEPVEEKFQLIISSANTNHGTTSNSGSFPKGIRTIQAFPKNGYEFSYWDGENIENEYAAITQINLIADSNVVAHFQSIGLFEDSGMIENDWWDNPWFGYFWKVGEGDWLFHTKFGWIFLKKKGDNSIWLWIQKMNGWYWSAKEHYPYLYSASTQTWYWANLENSDFTRLLIYDYANAKWLSL